MYYESYLQASFQLFIIVNEDIPSNSNAVLRVGSVVISCLSLFYGLCKIDLMNKRSDAVETRAAVSPEVESQVKSSQVETGTIMKRFLAQLLSKMCLFLRALICFSLYYVHENMLTSAIKYTCLDFLAIIVFFIISVFKYDFLWLLSFHGIKGILNPSSILFKLRGGDIRYSFSLLNSIYTLWYSLLGIIFSYIFLTSDLSCNESCDQFDRISRFYVFFLFTLVINVLALIYNFFIFVIFAHLTRVARA